LTYTPRKSTRKRRNDTTSPEGTTYSRNTKRRHDMSEHELEQELEWLDKSYENDTDPWNDNEPYERRVIQEDLPKKDVIMKEMIDQNAELAEAPASWNTKYIDSRGFECQITLRAITGKELLQKVGAAMDSLLRDGCTPWPDRRGGKKNPSSNSSEAWCSIHDCEMQRHEKDGKHWYSHKVGDFWCKGADPNV
jgi:hypothetical protein